MEKKMQQKIDAFNIAYNAFDKSNSRERDQKEKVAAEAAKELVNVVLENHKSEKGEFLNNENDLCTSNYELLLKLTRVNFEEALKIANELDFTQLKKFYSQSLKIGQNELSYYFIRTAVQNKKWDVIKDIFSQKLVDDEVIEDVISMLCKESNLFAVDEKGLENYKDMLKALSQALNSYGAHRWMRSKVFAIVSTARSSNHPDIADSPESLKAELEFYSNAFSLLERDERYKVLFEKDVMRCSLFYNLTELSRKLGDFSELNKMTSFLTKEEKEKLAIETNSTGYHQVYKIVDRFVKDKHNEWTGGDKVKYYATCAACTVLSWYLTRTPFLPPVVNMAMSVCYGKMFADGIYSLSKPDAKKFGLGAFASAEVGGGISF